MTRKRPYIRLTQVQLTALYQKVKSDLPQLTDLVYELQFRACVDKPFKAQALEQLLRLKAQQPAPAPPPTSTPVTLVTTEPGFPFPSSDIVQTRIKLMAHRFAGKSWHEVGLLKASGYVVGSSEGKKTDERWRILNWVFLCDELKGVDDPYYAEEWGTPKSSLRLQKMANSLAAFARNAQRSPNDMRVAIKEWKEDLDYLYHTFYTQWHKFPWPHIEV